MSERIWDFDGVFAAMCIIEEIADPVLRDAGSPWAETREQNGINQLRHWIIENLAEPCNAAWERAYKLYEDDETDKVPDPGGFDYDFVPVWLRTAVDWSDPHNGPRVRGQPHG